MLKVKDLSIRYGSKQVVNNINLALGEDEILMLVGPTGCGKTTILQSLAGLIPIEEGEITLGSWRATAKHIIPPEKRNVGMVFQDFALFPHMTVEQNVCFRLKSNELADHWLNLLGLDAYRGAKPENLSGGQKQRVALARTLAHEPKFVLLDEPLSNLDAALKDNLRWEIRNALKKACVPAIWVTHDQDEALSVGDRIGVLKDGELQQLATPEECFNEPASRFVAGFLGDASFISGVIQGGMATTDLGSAPCEPINCHSNDIDLLLRPDDVSVQASPDGNAIIDWVRYEGGARLYQLTTDAGQKVKARTSHENKIMPGDKVQAKIVTTHPLAAFDRI